MTDEAGLLAAVNQGIAEAAAPPAPTMAPTTLPPPEIDRAEAAPDGPGDEGSPETEGPGGDPAKSPPDDAEPREGDAEKPVEGDVPGTGDTPPKVESEPPGEPAKPAEVDPLQNALDAPIPNALKRETKERIQILSGKVRELVPKLEETTRDRDMLVEMVQRTGANPQQYQQALGYLSLVNSPSRVDREQALQMMQAEVSVLARSLGKAVPGVNMLEGYPDLIQAVGSGQIAPEYANQIAASREREKLERQGSQARTQQAATNQQFEQAQATARQQLNQLEVTLSHDPNYLAKKPILVTMLKPVFAKLHPSEWAAAFQQAYNALPAPVVPRPTAAIVPAVSTAANGGGNTPLRASNPAGGARKAPTSLAEAVEYGIQDAGEIAMPIRKVKGGFKYGNRGKVYKTREGAEKQAAAIHASGFKEKKREPKSMKEAVSEGIIRMNR